MRRCVMALAIVALLAGCGDVSAPDGPRPPVPRILELVSGRPSDLGYRLIVRDDRPGVRAITDRRKRTITLYLARGYVAHAAAHDLAHELGHAYDDRRMTDRERRAYLKRRGVPRALWWPGTDVSDYTTGAGDFAEVFALCHAASPVFRSRLAPRPANPCGLLPGAAAGGTLQGGG